MQNPLLELSSCPHCNIDIPSLIKVTDFHTKDHLGGNTRFWSVYNCRRCGGVVTASWSSSGAILKVYPKQSNVDSNIPERARGYLQEAINTKHSPSACIMVAASSIDSMLKENNYLTGSLYDRINKAVEDHLITKEMGQWAHHVRLDSNKERHSDHDSVLPTVEEAQKVIDFAVALGEFLFVLPSRVAEGLK